jgi:3-oxoacyl-[acyl-carrier-protein] synthase-3
LIGDAASISIIENTESTEDIYFQMYSDGKQRDALIIPAGGFAMPCSEETSQMKETEDGNCRSLDNLHMDGTGVFNFVQVNVPPMIQGMLEETGVQKEDIDYYLFHQPNKFMLKKLADKMEVPYEKMFMNIVENFGNPSGVSIPINIVYNLSHALEEHTYYCCLSGFGSGLAWGAMLLQLGEMDFCEMVETNL